MVDLLAPGALHSAATFDDARELVKELLAIADPDQLADLLEHVVDNSDRAHAVLMLLVFAARGIPIEATGVELVAAETAGALIVPEGVRRAR